jgi:integrase
MSNRLTIVRGFAIYLKSIDPKTEIPPSDLLPWKRCRATPYLYSKEEVLALISAAKTLKFPHLAATFQTLIGLLTVTGMRISEAIHLDREDFDSNQKLLTVREGKFGKSRILPLHSSTARALRDYLSRRDQPRLVANTSALLISSVGKRLSPSSVQETFRKLRRKAGLKPRSASCRPRIHDFRHSFAVNTLLESYRSEEDPGTKLPLLSTYLGHVDPKNTYWYLSAAPELMKLAGNRLERHLGGAL